MLEEAGLDHAIDDSSDEEIVFVGRGGRMLDTPPSPTVTYRRQDRAEYIEAAKEREEEVQREKLVFESLAADRAASFGYVVFIVVGLSFSFSIAGGIFLLQTARARMRRPISHTIADLFLP